MPATGRTTPAEELALSGVSVNYDGRTALDDVSLRVPHGAHVAVVGPNGAGKSTLFKAVVGLLPARSGTITVHGATDSDERIVLAYVPQREEIDWRFPVTVRDVVMMGRFDRLGRLRRPRADDRVAVDTALGQLAIGELAERPIGELSGGQQQRVFLARALAQEPHVLLLDEPFTGVDAAVREGIIAVLDDLKRQGLTVLASTHDLGLAARQFDLVLLLNRHVVAFGSPRDVLTPEAISHTFGTQATVLNGMVVIDQCCPAPGDDGVT